MTVDNTIRPDHHECPLRASLDSGRYHPYRKENNCEEFYSNKEKNASTQTFNWKGREVANPPDPNRTPGQIMFLPRERPGVEVHRQAWNPEGRPMDPEGYNHPVLILTNKDDEGFVVVQKAITTSACISIGSL